MFWFSLASISLFLFTANALIIVPYPTHDHDIPMTKRFPAISSQTNSTTISGCCFEKNSASLGYWCRINLDGYVYGVYGNDIDVHRWKHVSEHYYDVSPRPFQASPVSASDGKTNHSSVYGVYGYDIEEHRWKDVSEHYYDVCPRPVQASPVSASNVKTNHSSLIVDTYSYQGPISSSGVHILANKQPQYYFIVKDIEDLLKNIEEHRWKDVLEHYYKVIEYKDVLKHSYDVQARRPVRASPVSASNGKTNHWSLIVGLNMSFALLLFVLFGVYSSVKKHMLINTKSRLFKKNGGLLLEQHIANSHGPGGPKNFTAEELQTTGPGCYYNEISRTVSPGASSSTSAGTINGKLLPEDSVMDMVFVTEKVLVEEGQIEHFINEVITLARINHQNVIKFFGCCLETEAPILVYELASNGTLFDYIHDRKYGENVLPLWDILIEIASESAAGLAYLHSQSIIHGNVKSSNILLTDHFAKIAGFGPPRLVPSNESQISTLVHSTLGYLDPEYLLTGQLTYKSDVYSFGVVLVEILIGVKPICFNRPENQRFIICHFLLSMEIQDGLYRILAPQVKEENKEQVRAVAELAKQCLKLSSAERPTMEEVASELKRLSDTYLTVHVN